MKPRIETPPRDNLKRIVCGTQPWPLAGGDVAVHEAGHVVVAMTLAMPVHNARITTGAAAGRAGVLAPVGDALTASPLAPDEVARIYLQAACLIWPGLSPADAALNYATMLTAGRQAEMIAAGHALVGELRMHDPDHLQARAVLAATGQRLAMAWAQRQARHLLTAAWPEVEAVAVELRRRGVWINSAQWERVANPSNP